MIFFILNFFVFWKYVVVVLNNDFFINFFLVLIYFFGEEILVNFKLIVRKCRLVYYNVFYVGIFYCIVKVIFR